VTAVTGLELDTGELRAAAESMSPQLDRIIADSEEHRELVRRLEAAFDGEAATSPDFSGLPSGDELAAELERYLRGEHGER